MWILQVIAIGFFFSLTFTVWRMSKTLERISAALEAQSTRGA